jgi:diaminopimelate epimerase
MAELLLRKYHGLGNDYLIYDPQYNEPRLLEPQIQRLCRRNVGIGADGVLYGPFFDGDGISVRIFNPDGSEAERSGNGIRIFSRYLKDMGYVTGESYELTTRAGRNPVTFLDDAGNRMRVDMGCAAFAAESIPVVGFGEEIVGESVFFCDGFYNVTCVSVGNPNCVILLEEVSAKAARHLGPYVENSKYFPNRINMQLCRIEDRKNIQIEIYERGAGYTTASGTGACAAAAAMHRLGLVDDAVTVHMSGGELFVEFIENHIFLTGPVAYVGKITVEESFFT